MKYLFLLTFSYFLPMALHAADTPPPTDHAALRERVLGVFDMQFARFRDRAGALATSSKAHCSKGHPLAKVKADFRATWLAWAPLDAYQFGPIEATGAALTVNFFPDKKGFVARALKPLRKLSKAEQADPTVIARRSAAAQGLPAIERLIYDGDAPCPLLIGITGNLADISSALYDGWFAPGGWADLVRDAGPDNPVYLSDKEFTGQIFTTLGFSLLRIKDHRLSRPLGTFERAFPKRAEAWRSGLTNSIIDAQLAGMGDIVEHGFADALTSPTRTELSGLIVDARNRMASIDAPLKDAVEDLGQRVRIEGLQSKLTYLQTSLDNTVGPELGVEGGFSAGDGD